jgi:hypothetical protein
MEVRFRLRPRMMPCSTAQSPSAAASPSADSDESFAALHLLTGHLGRGPPGRSPGSNRLRV